jgi:hypothetical protein
VKTDEVTAVILTRGNVPLDRILASLPYDKVIVWNEQERGHRGLYARYLAAREATTPVAYFQDDDIVFTAHDELLAAFDWDRMVVNMPSPWWEDMGYAERNECRVGAGSLTPTALPALAIARYLEHYKPDDLFYERTDIIVGMLAPFTRYDFGYEILPWATDPGRINTTPGAQEKREEMMRRVEAIRDAR